MTSYYGSVIAKERAGHNFHFGGGCTCGFCSSAHSLAADSNTDSVTTEVEELRLKNKQLQEELRRIRSNFLMKEIDLTELRKDEPEIAKLIENNRAWVNSKIVSNHKNIWFIKITALATTINTLYMTPVLRFK